MTTISELSKFIKTCFQDELIKYLNGYKISESDISEAMERTKLEVCHDILSKHLKIEVTATPQQILNNKVTIQLESLDEIGRLIIDGRADSSNSVNN